MFVMKRAKELTIYPGTALNKNMQLRTYENSTASKQRKRHAFCLKLLINQTDHSNFN